MKDKPQQNREAHVLIEVMKKTLALTVLLVMSILNRIKFLDVL